MTEAILDFVKNLIEKEYEAVLAQYLERDEQVFKSKVDALNPYLGEGIDLKITRPSPGHEWYEEWLVDGKGIIEQGNKQPRTLFQIKEYLHPDYPQMYRVYVSLPMRVRGRIPPYDVNFYIIPEGGTFKIISKYDIDIAPDLRGTRMKVGGLIWVWRCGIRLKKPGKLVQSWKFQPPNDPEHCVEYDAE